MHWNVQSRFYCAYSYLRVILNDYSSHNSDVDRFKFLLRAALSSHKQSTCPHSSKLYYHTASIHSIRSLLSCMSSHDVSSDCELVCLTGSFLDFLTSVTFARLLSCDVYFKIRGLIKVWGECILHIF